MKCQPGVVTDTIAHTCVIFSDLSSGGFFHAAPQRRPANGPNSGQTPPLSGTPTHSRFRLLPAQAISGAPCAMGTWPSPRLLVRAVPLSSFRTGTMSPCEPVPCCAAEAKKTMVSPEYSTTSEHPRALSVYSARESVSLITSQISVMDYDLEWTLLRPLAYPFSAAVSYGFPGKSELSTADRPANLVLTQNPARLIPIDFGNAWHVQRANDRENSNT